ncbi:CehA/McbA family metallohydrolase [Actinophytocola xanthii]|uniref:Histidinol phosphatase n=1 Tax=Actinophytocola xanthii TaxID=1912961 RepID=A0A1Q8CP02_9PSEU|nr:CehA/McbA family metallohydrolase [Actinophytocola xanthii]OLF16089.1 histidinol phosphatase [Actinophytocola xanthii]
MQIVHRGRWTREDRAADPWPGLPFEVPPAGPGITVELEVARPDAVIDLGCAGAAGWRGWSGGARSRFVITPTGATPGYLPGELEPGTWQVVLGLHRVPAQGVEVTVTVRPGGEVEPERPWPPVPDRPPRRVLPALPGLRWVAADLHAHTLHSDGELTIAELAARAVSAGLDALAVTDHNTTSHHAHLAEVGRHYGVALVPGQEVTTDLGHANAFGDIGWVDFREPAPAWVSTVQARGGLLSVNHPLAADCAWRHPLPHRPPLAEVWHSSWLAPTWGGPVAWWQAWGADTTPVGGSDWHRPDGSTALGVPTTWVAVDAAARTPDELVPAVLDGLAAGRTAVSRDREAPVLLPLGDELLALGASGALVLGPGYRAAVMSDSDTVRGGGQVLCSHDGSVLALAGRS